MNNISRKEKNCRRKVQDHNMVRKWQQRRKKKTPRIQNIQIQKKSLPNKEKRDKEFLPNMYLSKPKNIFLNNKCKIEIKKKKKISVSLKKWSHRSSKLICFPLCKKKKQKKKKKASARTGDEEIRTSVWINSSRTRQIQRAQSQGDSSQIHEGSGCF